MAYVKPVEILFLLVTVLSCLLVLSAYRDGRS
jgi:hypothetical protein